MGKARTLPPLGPDLAMRCRVDAPEGGGSSESLIAAALAAIAGEQHQRTGSAVYLLASMLNHSCSPNADVSFPFCNGEALLPALHGTKSYEQRYCQVRSC